jgi:YHS domain-containing protein
LAKDPVCGMDVNEEQAELISEHKGAKYYFCSNICKENFDKDPEKYI